MSSTFKSESLNNPHSSTYSDCDLCSLHLDAVIATGSSFSHQLEAIELGDSETGKGSRLRDDAVI